ncbi:MAG: metallophosphoesterase family protein, partial [Chloroflexota bacterium]
NTWALDAVLADIRRRGIDTIFNLGDSVFNCLDPAGTAARLMDANILSVMGNQDRDAFAPNDVMRASRDYAFVSAELNAVQVAWLAACPPTYTVDDILLCHGTPHSDETYLLETVTEHGVFLSDTATILSRLENIDAKLILCGHSHVPRVVWLPGNRLVVNPGSVGIPAYDDDVPMFHIMESGSPHARYAILTRRDHFWDVESVCVAYDWSIPAARARAFGRPDRAHWIETGRVS